MKKILKLFGLFLISSGYLLGENNTLSLENLKNNISKASKKLKEENTLSEENKDFINNFINNPLKQKLDWDVEIIDTNYIKNAIEKLQITFFPELRNRFLFSPNKPAHTTTEIFNLLEDVLQRLIIAIPKIDDEKDQTEIKTFLKNIVTNANKLNKYFFLIAGNNLTYEKALNNIEEEINKYNNKKLKNKSEAFKELKKTFPSKKIPVNKIIEEAEYKNRLKKIAHFISNIEKKEPIRELLNLIINAYGEKEEIKKLDDYIKQIYFILLQKILMLLLTDNNTDNNKNEYKIIKKTFDLLQPNNIKNIEKLETGFLQAFSALSDDDNEEDDDSTTEEDDDSTTEEDSESYDDELFYQDLSTKELQENLFQLTIELTALQSQMPQKKLIHLTKNRSKGDPKRRPPTRKSITKKSENKKAPIDLLTTLLIQYKKDNNWKTPTEMGDIKLLINELKTLINQCKNNCDNDTIQSAKKFLNLLETTKKEIHK